MAGISLIPYRYPTQIQKEGKKKSMAVCGGTLLRLSKRGQVWVKKEGGPSLQPIVKPSAATAGRWASE